MSHPVQAAEFLKDAAKSKWHDETLWFVRDKRDKISQTIPEWEQLRELASQIKDNVLANLDTYLEEFEQKALQNGIQVHWEKDAA
jgi:L-lactate dehydrogenase complex protein LldF